MRALLVLLLALTACKLRIEYPPIEEFRTDDPPFKPPVTPEGEKDWDWLQLTSDEWLKGEIKYMQNETLEIDSDELDDLKFEWRKVKRMRTPRIFSLLRSDQTDVMGTVAVRDNTVVVKEKENEFLVFDRKDLVTMVPGGKTERSYWSGKLSVGLTIRTGNTEQEDLSLTFNVRRRTPRNRLEIDYKYFFSRANEEELANNQRLAGRYDIFFARRWFFTPIAAEFYRDPFQNIALRITPLIGVGYNIFSRGIDKGPIDWDVSVLGGYRFTQFDSGAPDDGTAVIAFSTSVDWDITKKLEAELSYDLQLSVEALRDNTQNLTFDLSYDIYKDLDFDFTIVWNFVGAPRPDENGDVPEKADFRFIFGLGWEF
ncbi:MAG: DUF481 domain-containing protein [Planctomycetota bacterium]